MNLLTRLLPVVIGLNLASRLHAQNHVSPSAACRVAAPSASRQVFVSATGTPRQLPADLSVVFPKLRSALNPTEDIGALRRVLVQLQLEPLELGALPAAGQERIESTLKDYAEKLTAAMAATRRPSDNPIRSIMELNALKHRSEDLLAAMRFMELKNGSELTLTISQDLANLTQALIERSDALTEKVLASLPGAVRYGRTVVMPAGNGGSSVALKFAKLDNGVEGEGPGMERAVRFGIDAPVALPSGSGYVRTIDGQAPQAQYGTAFMAYLLPGKLAGEYFSYLGDILPKAWSRKQKTQAVKSSALNAVDGMLRLFENGWVHGTLAALSHSKSAWEWDYWRGAGSKTLLEVTRYGPTGLHDWDEGLSYSNIRGSGLADFEELKPLPNHPALRRRAVGQNIFELSMLVMRAGYRNGLGARDVAGILAEVLQRHAFGIAGDSGIKIDRMILLPLLTGIARRLYIFYVFADIMPRGLVRRYHDAVSRVVLRPIPAGESLVMPGEIVHPLIMDVVKPYVEALIGGFHAPPGEGELWVAILKSRFFAGTRSRFKKIVSLAIRPAIALLLGFETAPYLGKLGRFRQSWIWRKDSEQDAGTRLRSSAFQTLFKAWKKDRERDARERLNILAIQNPRPKNET